MIVLTDVAEHPVLDPVPFAHAGREMAHGDREPNLVDQLLQFGLPCTCAIAVADHVVVAATPGTASEHLRDGIETESSFSEYPLTCRGIRGNLHLERVNAAHPA